MKIRAPVIFFQLLFFTQKFLGPINQNIKCADLYAGVGRATVLYGILFELNRFPRGVARRGIWHRASEPPEQPASSADSESARKKRAEWTPRELSLIHI
eukprot:14549980-Alexandrium_andersonii.AAC.1